MIISVCPTHHENDHSKLRAYAFASAKKCWLVLELEKKIKVSP